jgi:4-diphosphocytidyl-2-C-methyl-D-erythritol kinase
MTAVARGARAEAPARPVREARQARSVTVCAPAKVNLFLHVGGRRPDGYHDLESLVAFTEAGDRIDVSAAEEGVLTLDVEGPFAHAVPGGDGNLVLKAARALDASVESRAPGARGRGAHIRLEKNLPVAAGIGGGSADAAATLRALNLLWQLNRGEAHLLALAAGLGSDVPACLLSRPLWMSGRGEVVRAAPALPPLKLILINPGVAVETAQVFAALGERADERTGLGGKPHPRGLDTPYDVEAYLFGTRNDLQAPAMARAPEIARILDLLELSPSCRLARMSGSGATCFGIFDWRNGALFAAEEIALAHPAWWVRVTRIAGPDIGAPHWSAA